MLAGYGLDKCAGCKAKEIKECFYYESGIPIGHEEVKGGESYQKKHYPYRDGCFWELIDSGIWDLIDMYGHYKNGHLWFDPLISHNPNWYVQAMKILDAKLKQPKLEL